MTRSELDDYSFVFENAGRDFTDNEKKDILALAHLMSVGFYKLPMNEKEFPSWGRFDEYMDHYRLLYSGDYPSGSRDGERVISDMQELAGQILDEKYPEVAGMIREATGQKLNNATAYLCMELRQNVAIEEQLHMISDGIPEKFIRERAEKALSEAFVSDNTLLVLRGPEDYFMAMGRYFNASLLSRDDWNTMERTNGVTAVYNHNLQLAACCVKEGLEPTVANMDAICATPRFVEFCREQDTRRWEFQERLLAALPPEKRYDDWSFVYGLTDRKFTDDEKRDIQALGCIMSTGIQDELLTKDRFPSLGDLQPEYDALAALTYGVFSIGAYDISRQEMAIKNRAGEILSEKYPEVAAVMKDLCGMPTGVDRNEVHALLSASGEPLHVRVAGPASSFYSYAARHSAKEHEKHPVPDYSLVRYRFGDLSLVPGSGLTSEEIWRQVTDVARKNGIEPMNVVSLHDAVYCFVNCRNPLHPDNQREKLLQEKPYLEYCAKFRESVDVKTANEQKKPLMVKSRPVPNTKKKGKTI